jgi:hypothetical protein
LRKTRRDTARTQRRDRLRLKRERKKAHLHPVLNIPPIDLANLEMADKMYLDDELMRFLNEQREEQPVATYLRAGSGCFLMQNLSSNRKLLLDAVIDRGPLQPNLRMAAIGMLSLYLSLFAVGDRLTIGKQTKVRLDTVVPPYAHAPARQRVFAA